MPTRKFRSDPQRKLPATHARACVVGRSRPTPANRHLFPIGRDRRPSTTPAAHAVTPARARKSPRLPDRVSSSLDLTGTVRISRWRYEHIFAGNWHIATGNPLDWPKPTYCANRPVACPLGGNFRTVHFLLFVCLPVSSVCRHSLRSLVIGRSIDQCPRSY